MKDLINYLVPRTLVLAAVLFALKSTVWPTMSLPFPVAFRLEPVWRATAALKQTVTEPVTGRSRSEIVESVGSRSDSRFEASGDSFRIEISPAGSEAKKLPKPKRSVANGGFIAKEHSPHRSINRE